MGGTAASLLLLGVAWPDSEQRRACAQRGQSREGSGSPKVSAWNGAGWVAASVALQLAPCNGPPDS
jgi:hypothetical protein